MKRQNIIITGVMLFTAVVSLFYLPAELAIQWNENGVSGTASKFLILLFPALGALFPVLRREKCLLVPLLLFAAQGVITLNALGYIDMLSLNYRLMQTIVLLLIGLLLCVCGNYLPKFPQNLYRGVKTPLAYGGQWTKTQRFAGKLWFVSGLGIMLLSFVPWEGVGIAALCIVLGVIILPRVVVK